MSLAQDVIALAVQTGLATFVTGPPGTGKTLWTRALGKALGRHVVTHICALHPPEDYAGIPAPNFEAHHAPLLPVGDLKPTLEAHPDAIVLLDDVSWATPATQAALLRLPFEHVMGDWAMPSTCTFVLCKNTTEQAGGGYDIIPPLANRGLHVTWDAGNVQTWISGQLAGWPPPVVPRVPAKWRDHLMAAHALVGGYLAHQPHKLHVEPKTPEDGGGPWPSRRSWGDLATPMLAACLAAGQSDETQHLAVYAAVGPVATEFAAWRREASLPDPEHGLLHPDDYKLPARSDQQYAALIGLVGAVRAKTTKDRYLAAWRIVGRYAKTLRDTAAMAAAQLIAIGQEHITEYPIPQDLKELDPILTALRKVRGEAA